MFLARCGRADVGAGGGHGLCLVALIFGGQICCCREPEDMNCVRQPPSNILNETRRESQSRKTGDYLVGKLFGAERRRLTISAAFGVALLLLSPASYCASRKVLRVFRTKKHKG